MDVHDFLGTQPFKHFCNPVAVGLGHRLDAAPLVGRGDVVDHRDLGLPARCPRRWERGHGVARHAVARH